MCLVVFQKIFQKIFSGVWKMLQGKDKPISTPDKTQIDARLGSTERCFVSSSPTTVPSITISRSTAPLREIAIGAKARSRSTALVLANGADQSLRSTAPSNPSSVERPSGFFSCFSGFVFSLQHFPNTRKYFSGNFLKYNQTHKNIFLSGKQHFRKMEYFPEMLLREPNAALDLS